MPVMTGVDVYIIPLKRIPMTKLYFRLWAAFYTNIFIIKWNSEFYL